MKDKVITSPSNPLFKTLKSLLTASGIRSEGQCLIPGAKMIQEILEIKNSQQNQDLQWNPVALVGPRGFDFKSIYKIQKIELAKELFKELDTLGTGSPLLLCQTPQIQKSDLTTEPKGLEIIAPLQDPQNMGALIRSAAAFGVQKIHLTKESCSPFLPKSIKSSANGILHLEFSQAGSLEALRSSKQNLFILDSKGKDLSDILNSKKIPLNGFLLLGEEGLGHLRNKEILESPNSILVSISTQNVESLNATIAASIFLYQWSLRSNS